MINKNENEKLVYLGHASFLYLSKEFLVLMDPWLSSEGAYFNSWYQFPCNHHLESQVINMLRTDNRKKYIYLSHHDKDHLDVNFLKKISDVNATYLIPNFSKKDEMFEKLTKESEIRAQDLFLFNDMQEICIDNTVLKFYIQDSSRESDSSVLIKTENFNFFNTNDCKIHDRIPSIIKSEGEIDLLTMQFSGASWYPVVYQNMLGDEKYFALSKHKKNMRFRVVSNTIKNCKVKNFMPSAGPPCFLDPFLFHINFQRENIFPDARQIINFLVRRNKTLNVIDANPGEQVCLNSFDVKKYFDDNFYFNGVDPYEEKNKYLKMYQNLHIDKFKTQEIYSLELVTEKFAKELRKKLESFDLKSELQKTLYFKIIGHKCRKIISVDFINNKVQVVEDLMTQESYYLIVFRLKDIALYIDSSLNFHDLLLSCRQKMHRSPDIYDYLIDSFLCLDADDFKKFKEGFNEKSSNVERLTVTCGQKKYEIDRYCPHEKADLKYAEVTNDGHVVCPRHCWEFDLNQAGKCAKISKYTINSVEIS